MISRLRLGTIAGSLAVVVAFGLGLFVPARGGLPELWSAIRPGTSRGQLNPLQTYNKVLQQLKGKYVGPLKSDREITYTAIRGMLRSLEDPYTRFLDPQRFRLMQEENRGNFVGIGAQLEGRPTSEGYVRITRPLPDNPAIKAGIKAGDLIVKVDGKSVVGQNVDEVVKWIKGKEGEKVVLTIRRGEKEFDITIIRQRVEFEVVTSRMLAGNIGYISLAQFNEVADQKIGESYQKLSAMGMKGLVLDLRGNPGGLLDSAIDISSRFLPAGRPVVIIVEAGGQRDVRRAKPGRRFRNPVPVVVLVNRTSASASEIVAGALQDNNAGTIVGTTTFGKGLVQTVIPLQDGSATMITTHKYLTANGRDINRGKDHRGGVAPDVEVQLTQEQFLARKDAQLDKALEILHQKTGFKPAVAAAIQ